MSVKWKDVVDVDIALNSLKENVKAWRINCQDMETLDTIFKLATEPISNLVKELKKELDLNYIIPKNAEEVKE